MRNNGNVQANNKIDRIFAFSRGFGNSFRRIDSIILFHEAIIRELINKKEFLLNFCVCFLSFLSQNLFKRCSRFWFIKIKFLIYSHYISFSVLLSTFALYYHRKFIFALVIKHNITVYFDCHKEWNIFFINQPFLFSFFFLLFFDVRRRNFLSLDALKVSAFAALVITFTKNKTVIFVRNTMLFT